MASTPVTTSRRSILGAVAIAPIAIVAPALAHSGDSVIDCAWAEWLSAQRLLYSQASRNSDEVFMAASRRVDAAEDVVMKAAATTTSGILAKLLISLPHMVADRWVEEAIVSGKIQTLFDREADLDFPARLVAQVIRSLQQMEH